MLHWLRRKLLARRIESVLARRFAGARFKVTIERNGDWECFLLPGSPLRFDELYSGKTKKQRDAQIIADIENIFHRHNLNVQGYERDGKYHRL